MECRVFNNLLQSQVFLFLDFRWFFGVSFFFTVESRFLELDGDSTNYEDSRYRGGKYRKKQITNKPI